MSEFAIAPIFPTTYRALPVAPFWQRPVPVTVKPDVEKADGLAVTKVPVDTVRGTKVDQFA